MFTLLRRWFSWDGAGSPFAPNGPVTKTKMELDLTTRAKIEIVPTLSILDLSTTTRQILVLDA